MSDSTGAKPVLPGAVPLFPLPNTVLFPHAVLPLHIFEERYKKMTADALAGDRQIAMALLRPGWEKNYYGRAAIEPVVCVGTIVSHEHLANGEFNFLLQGHTRARVIREVGEEPYRQAQLEQVEEIAAPPEVLAAARMRLIDLFDQGCCGTLARRGQMRKLVESDVPMPIAVDLVAFYLWREDQIGLAHALLAEADVAKRVAALLEAVSALDARRN
jgi:Lon protease-like protein